MNHFFNQIDNNYSSITNIVSDFNFAQSDIYTWKQIWALNQDCQFVEFSDTVYSGCKFGSILAIHSPKYSTDCSTNQISLYDMQFNLVYQYTIKSPCEKLFFYVTSSDHLLVLTNRGKFLTFFGGHLKKQISFLPNSIDPSYRNVTAADFWDNGVVFVVQNEIYYSNLVDQPKLFKTLPDGYSVISEFKVIPSEYTDDNYPILFLTTFSSILTIITHDNLFTIDLETDILTFSFSEDYSLVAFICDPSVLIISNTSLDKTLLHIAIPNLEDITQICWIGNYAPVIAFKDEIATIGRIENDYDLDFSIKQNASYVNDDNPHYPVYGDLITIDQLRFPIPGKTHLFPSSDSVYVISCNKMFQLSHVSDELRSASRKGSTHHISILLDSFDTRSSSKLFKLRSMDEKLGESVQACIKISKELYFPEQQKTVLMSALYGKSYIPETSKFYNKLVADTDEIAQITKVLRICNALRTETNMLVNYNEMTKITLNDIFMRFCNRQLFSLAIEIANFLNVDKTAIMTEWCCSVTNAVSDDEQALKIIKAKFNDDFNATNIALAFERRGRPSLAQSVIENLETNNSRAVPFYIKNEQWGKAFKAAEASSDTSLFIEVLQKAIEKAESSTSSLTYQMISKVISSDFFLANSVARLYDSNKRDSKLGVVIDNIDINIKTAPVIVNRHLKEFINQVNSKKVAQDILLASYSTIERSIKMMINQHNISWGQSIYFALKFNMDIIQAEIALTREKGQGNRFIFKSFNEVFDRLVEAGDITSAMKIVKDLDLNRKRYLIKIGNVLINKDSDRFKELTDTYYQDGWYHFILMIYYKKGIDQATKFAQDIKDPKKSSEILAQFAQPDFPLSLINPKMSACMFIDSKNRFFTNVK